MKCNYCERSFGDIYTLIQHITIQHPQLRSYQCTNKNCFRKFLSIVTLKAHIFKCPYFQYSKVSSGDDNPIQTNLLTFIAKLYSNNSIANAVVQDIISNLINLTEDMKKFYLDKVIAMAPPETHQKLTNLFTSNNFDQFSTEFKRTSYLKTLQVYIPPEKFIIGEINDDKNTKTSTIKTTKQCCAQFVSMTEGLKNFLELPNVFQEVLNYMNNEIAKSSNDYTSLFQGTIWKNISKEYEGKILIPYYLYYDDFGVGDPLSPAATLHKMGGLYYSIAAIPPKFSSSVDTVLLAQLNYYSDYKEFRNAKCFCRVIEELKTLATKGVGIKINNKIETVYFALIGILGDNLAANSLLGFNQSFSSNYFCRFCRASKKATHELCEEDPKLLRTKQNYDEDVKSLSCGVKEECVFNSVPNFHNIENLSCDILHDFYLGICRYDMARIIKYFINQKFFTLEDLNERLKYFDFSEIDHGNKIAHVSEKHISQGYIIITGAEMSCLVTYFGIIIGDCVPEYDPVWTFYLSLFDIICMVTEDIFTQRDLTLLRASIKTHNELYKKLFDEDLSAKFHITTHYETIIKAAGPVKYLSCAKFESFHQKSRKYAHVVHSRVNICYSLANKLQLEFSYKLLSKEGFKNRIELGQSTDFKLSMTTSSLFEVLYVKVNGKTYKPGYAIYIRHNTDDNPVFGVITRIMTNSMKHIHFIYRECLTIGLVNHLKAFVLKLPNVNSVLKLYTFNVNEYIKPLKIHVTANGSTVVTCRDYR